MASQSVFELAGYRQAVLNSFGDEDNEAADLAIMDKLVSVEDQILNAEFRSDAEKLAGFLVLFELNDAPNFADQFKAKLFSRIHQFT
jgi:hypothetical protein